MAKSTDTEATARGATKRAATGAAGTKSATRSATTKSGAGKSAAKSAAKSATKSANNRSATAKSAATTSTGKSPAKRAGTKPAARSASSRSATSRSATTRSAATRSATKPRKTRSVEEVERIRIALDARGGELREEYQQHLAEIAELQRGRLTDSAGDDQADTGSKTFEREQEISLANSILERITQVERALERLNEGSYGWCERCGDAIPVERLAAFPSATLCVKCKQLEERR
jgi:RNA polymerase-binding protein DksA